MAMAEFDRGCVKTRLRSNFGSIKTPPDPEIIAYSAFYEVVVRDIVFRAEFLHSLDPLRPVVRHSSGRSCSPLFVEKQSFGITQGEPIGTLPLSPSAGGEVAPDRPLASLAIASYRCADSGCRARASVPRPR